MKNQVAAVLFDLDGTLVDSAPDLGGAANEMRVVRGLAPLSLAHFRPMTGAGARGMVMQALAVGPDDAGYSLLRDEFLLRYEARLTKETVTFPGIAGLLDHLRASNRPWGIVTNKAMRFAEPLVRALGLDRNAALVGGDTTPHAKPHPAPLLEAARRMGLRPADCVYVGDDLRDMVAGRAAGMFTAVASWGYLGTDQPVTRWGADTVCDSPADLLNWLEMT